MPSKMFNLEHNIVDNPPFIYDVPDGMELEDYQACMGGHWAYVTCPQFYFNAKVIAATIALTEIEGWEVKEQTWQGDHFRWYLIRKDKHDK